MRALGECWNATHILTHTFSFKGLNQKTLLKIKLEVDTEPPPGFSVEPKALMEPIPVSINSYVTSDLFAGKMHAVLCRAWKHRIKGRDWYDFVWYVRKGIFLNLAHLEKRMWQSGCLASTQKLTQKCFDEMLTKKIANLDIDLARNDVQPFINDIAQVSSWTKDYFMQFASQIKYSE